MSNCLASNYGKPEWRCRESNPGPNVSANAIIKSALSSKNLISRGEGIRTLIPKCENNSVTSIFTNYTTSPATQYIFNSRIGALLTKNLFVPEAGVEPAQPRWLLNFKSSVSTYFTIPATRLGILKSLNIIPNRLLVYWFYL